MKKLLVLLSLIFVSVSYADTETINWYVDGSVYNTTTCQTGGDITLQTPPTKRGHTFTGWQVALYDFSTLDPDVAGTDFTYTASNMIWSTTFPYGVVSGTALCSITPGSWATAGAPDETTPDGQNCWCKATAYIPSGTGIVYKNTSTSVWGLHNENGSASECVLKCAYYCGYAIQVSSALRRTVFGVTQ